MEQDLSSRAAAALNGAGLSWAATGFQGRDGVLTGRASDVSDPDKAMSLLSNVWGVRVVDNRADLIEQVENYVWFASRRNNRVRLTGYVPQANARQVILGVARASFPGFEIQDRMKLARGVPSVDAWLGGVSFALKQLTSLKRGDA
ncbi:BON domain-containing protein, partial [Herbaspirillum sp. HC18]